MTLTLRPYQDKAISDLWRWFGDNEQGNPLVVLPTGSGKSLVQADWLQKVFEADSNSRVLCVTHSRELVSQNFAELIGLWPEAPAGINSAGLNRRDIHSKIVFCSIQSVYKKAFDFQRCDLVIIDEAHMLPNRADTMYRKFLGDLKIINPYMRVIGMTATPYRLTSGMLHKGEGALFTDIAHETGVLELFDAGYLCPPVTYKRTASEIDVAGVGSRMGEYIQIQLEKAAMDAEIIESIAADIVDAGFNRKSWLVFGVSVAHCRELQKAIAAHGVAVECVFGETDKTERNSIISDFKALKTQCLVSRDVLSIGFNARSVDLIALCRPTKSTGIYIQQVGRGTRLSPETGKENCIILDYAGAVKTHGTFDDPVKPREKKKGAPGDAPHRVCPECEQVCAVSFKICPSCGEEFEIEESASQLLIAPDNKPILSSQTIEPEWLEVAGVEYKQHSKPGSPDSLRVEYRVGFNFHKEWVLFNHTGYPRSKAESWWLRRAPAPVPRSVAEAIERAGELAEPSQICVGRDGKYDRVTKYDFQQPKAEAA
jgi:DNA repair protein RadD